MRFDSEKNSGKHGPNLEKVGDFFPNKIIGDGLIEIWFSTNNQMSHPGQVVIGIRLSSMKTYLFHNMLFAV